MAKPSYNECEAYNLSSKGKYSQMDEIKKNDNSSETSDPWSEFSEVSNGSNLGVQNLELCQKPIYRIV